MPKNPAPVHRGLHLKKLARGRQVQPGVRQWVEISTAWTKCQREKPCRTNTEATRTAGRAPTGGSRRTRRSIKIESHDPGARRTARESHAVVMEL
jgi:hypothetical protein